MAKYLQPEPTEVVVDLPLRIVHDIFESGKLHDLYMEWCVVLKTMFNHIDVRGIPTREEVSDYVKSVRELPDQEGTGWKVYAVLHYGKRVEKDFDQ